MQRDPIPGGIRPAGHATLIVRRAWRQVLPRATALLFCCTTCALADTFPLWAGAIPNEWEDAAHATVLTDMSVCEPAAALSRTLKPGHWKVMPYEMVANGPRGKMVWAAPRAGAPELSLPLPVRGWFAVFVGLFSASEAPTTAWLALDTDPAPVPRSNGRSDYYANSVEVFFKVAELTERSRLRISQAAHGFPSACGITHVRLIPLTPAEIERIKADRRDRAHRTMAATIDGFSFIYARSPRTVREWLSEVEIYRNTDFGTLLLQSPGADKVIYPSNVGHMKGDGYEVFPRQGDHHFTESIRAMAEQKINPLKVLIDGAHDVGMNVHVGIRPAGWSFFEPYSDYWESPFYQTNPQWRCEDRDGTPVTRMSWAVPEVRRHMIDLLREQLGFGADGVHIAFNRGLPLVLYEPAARELFQAQHHVDPRTVPESDPRIRQWWADIVVTFFRELRTALDEEQQHRRPDGRPFALSVMILGSEEENLRYGIDVRRLIEERLIDEVFMDLWGFGATGKSYDLPFFRQVCDPRSIPFKPATASYWNAGPYYTLERMRSFYEGGASGVTIWDASIGDMLQWSVIARMGHVDETRWRLEQLKTAQPPDMLLRFHKLGEQILDGRYPPHWGG